MQATDRPEIMKLEEEEEERKRAGERHLGRSEWGKPAEIRDDKIGAAKSRMQSRRGGG